ncbi:MAG: DUF4058 family protein [Gemmataceae bacterium]|nr:DUF4058 family protein [Gemmataceae bacterium]
MPLHDHFHPPLSRLFQWQSFHHAWATVLAFDINRGLPPGYFAQPSVHLTVEYDVSALRRHGASPASGGYDPGDPSLTLATATALDSAEVQVISTEEGPVLVGAIDLVSPSNKASPDERTAFVDKCAALLRRRVGLVVIDIVTSRLANLHLELSRRIDAAGTPIDAGLYAVSYRFEPAGDRGRVTAWERSLELGRPLPTMPFWLRDLCVPVELEAAYQRTWDGLHMGPHTGNGAA